MPDVHAKLSASGAKKWISCPGSVALESTVEEQPSEYASEGTTAHTLGEAKIRLALKEYTRAKYHKAIKDLDITEEMEDCTDSYRDFVFESFGEMKRETEDTELFLEQRLTFSDYVPEGFGTGDCIIINNEHLHIIDLKYGKGVRVEAKDNPQLRLYALGVLETYGFLYEFQDVKMTIYQPRLDHIDSEVLSIAELQAWGASIKPTAEKAFAGSEECNAGSHCDSGFCKARPFCRAYSEKKLEMTRFEFAKPNTLTMEEISDILEEAEALSKWATIIKDYVLSKAINGDEIPGYKLVEGRSNRVFNVDDTLIANQLICQGYNDDDIWPRKLLPLGQIEKYLGKKTFQELLGNFVEKPQGKPVLVPITDARPAINSTESAVEDFKDTIVND